MYTVDFHTPLARHLHIAIVCTRSRALAFWLLHNTAYTEAIGEGFLLLAVGLGGLIRLLTSSSNNSLCTSQLGAGLGSFLLNLLVRYGFRYGVI